MYHTKEVKTATHIYYYTKILSIYRNQTTNVRNDQFFM